MVSVSAWLSPGGARTGLCFRTRKFWNTRCCPKGHRLRWGPRGQTGQRGGGARGSCASSKVNLGRDPSLSRARPPPTKPDLMAKCLKNMLRENSLLFSSQKKRLQGTMGLVLSLHSNAEKNVHLQRFASTSGELLTPPLLNPGRKGSRG